MADEYKHDFAWGDTRGIREIMMRRAPFLNFKTFEFGTFGYPPHSGRPELVESLRKLIFDLTGTKYTYVLVTNGALNGLAAYISAVRNDHTWGIQTNRLYFGRYPGLASNAGLLHRTDVTGSDAFASDIWVIDSPSNPEGELATWGRFKNCVWDAAYYTPTYCGTKILKKQVQPVHEAMVGSLNKLTGVNGLRIGWLATQDPEVYRKALEYITSDLCGVSQVSQVAANDIITKVDMPSFYAESKAMLDDNKGELTKLDYLFGYQSIPLHGMFVLFEVDQGIRDLLEKASVKIMDGSQCGDVPNRSIRFNLGNSVKDTKEMVKSVLATDGKK